MSALKHPEEEPLGARAYDHRLMGRLLRYLSPMRGLVALATAALLLFALCQIAGPILTRLAIDEYIAGGRWAGLVGICLVWVLLIGVGAGLQYGQMVLTNVIGQRANLALRTSIYTKLQRLPVTYYDRHPVGRLMTRLTNDVEVLNQMFTQGVVFIFGDIFTLLGIMITLLVLDWRLALVTFAAMPALVVASLLFRKVLRRAFRDARTALSRINAYLQEVLGGITVIKALRREGENEGEFGALADDHRDAFLRSVRAMGIYYPVVEVIEALTIALVIVYGSGRVPEAGIAMSPEKVVTLGSLVAFIQYAGRFFRPIRDLSEKYNILQDAMSSSERIFELLDEKEEDPGDAAGVLRNPGGTIRFRDLHFRYHPETPVLEGIDAELPAGRTTALVGSTGSGKTTLVHLLARFYDAQEGSITIGEQDIREVDRRTLRSHLAMVQQDIFLFSGTIEENIRLLSPHIRPETLARALAASHADRVVAAQPRGLATPVGERGASFSAGERQLIACARALAWDPDILILDEATASVDSETEALIQDGLRRLLAGRTAIVIAHRLSTILEADQILVMHRGRIVERGTHAELMAAGGRYADLVRLQFDLEG